MSPEHAERLDGPRGTPPEEMDKLVELLNSVFRPQTKSMTREHGYMYCPENGEGLRVMLAQGVPVSHYGTKLWSIRILGVPLLMASVGGVCTQPDYRGKGLATILLKDAEHQFHRKGVDLVLISGGRGLYVTNGYGRAGRCLVFELDASMALGLADSRFSIRETQTGDLPALARIGEQEPVRYERPFDELVQLVAGRQARIIPDRFVIVSCAGRDLAWFDVSTGFDGKTRGLWDYAGDRGAILAGLGTFMRQEHIDKLTAPILAHDEALAARLTALGVPAKQEDIPEHTLKILNFERFMEKMKPAFCERVGNTVAAKLRFENVGSGGAICLGSERLPIPDSRDVVKLVFGSQEDSTPAAGPAGGLITALLRVAFPLPLVWPGINYV